MGGAFAIIAAMLCFLVPLAIPLFAQRWQSFAVVLALGIGFFAWMNMDIENAGAAHWLGSFLGGLMLFGFAAGIIAKFVMLVSRRPEPPAGA